MREADVAANSGSEKQDDKSLDEIGSQNKETDANIFPEEPVVAEADLEKTGAAPPPTKPGGINPADFPDGGFEAWMVVLGAWACLFVCTCQVTSDFPSLVLT